MQGKYLIEMEESNHPMEFSNESEEWARKLYLSVINSLSPVQDKDKNVFLFTQKPGSTQWTLIECRIPGKRQPIPLEHNNPA